MSDWWQTVYIRRSERCERKPGKEGQRVAGFSIWRIYPDEEYRREMSFGEFDTYEAAEKCCLDKGFKDIRRADW